MFAVMVSGSWMDSTALSPFQIWLSVICVVALVMSMEPSKRLLSWLTAAGVLGALTYQLWLPCIDCTIWGGWWMWF